MAKKTEPDSAIWTNPASNHDPFRDLVVPDDLDEIAANAKEELHEKLHERTAAYRPKPRAMKPIVKELIGRIRELESGLKDSEEAHETTIGCMVAFKKERDSLLEACVGLVLAVNSGSDTLINECADRANVIISETKKPKRNRRG